MAFLPPKYQRVADRLKKLIEEGDEIAELPKPDRPGGVQLPDPNEAVYESWLTRSDNILRNTFGKGSAHFDRFNLHSSAMGNRRNKVLPVQGILQAAHDDLISGFLMGQQFLIAAEVFDSILEQARHLHKTGYKDPAAVLGRVVLEDSLRRIAREEEVDDTGKISKVNQQLWKEAERYSKPRWRQLQAWLDIGNDAAHGKFDNYTEEEVIQMLNGVEDFIASELST